MRTMMIRSIFIVMCVFFPGGLYVLQPSLAEPPPVNDDARVSYFYEALLPYGQWIWHNEYGWVWSPYNMPIDWRPYTDGHWEFTADGWTWVSDLPWGWACFHYGQWFYDDNYGWLWDPDTVWAPSWVAWRYNDDWIGWAPLSPRDKGHHRRGRGSHDHDADNEISRHAYSFARYHDFGDQHLADHIEPAVRNVTLINSTAVAVHTMASEKDRMVNHLPFEDKIVHGAGHPITPRKIIPADSPAQSGILGDEVRIYRPEVRHAGGKEEKATAVAMPQPQRGRIEPAHVNPVPAPESVVPHLQAPSNSPEVVARHDEELQKWEQMHAQQEQKLNADHAREVSQPPAGLTPEQLQRQHDAESQALREQGDRERQLIQSWQKREESIVTAPSAPPPRPYFIPQKKERAVRSDGEQGEHRRERE